MREIVHKIGISQNTFNLLHIFQVKKLYEEAVKYKENMVIRYAKSEREVQEQKKAREAVEHKLREVTQQSESLHVQIKQLRKELSKLKNSSEEKVNIEHRLLMELQPKYTNESTLTYLSLACQTIHLLHSTLR